MKEFLAAAVMFVILLYFPVQWSLQTYNHTLRLNVDTVVNKYAQEARVTGRFTPDSILAMKKDIAAKTNLSVTEIAVQATMTPKYRRDDFNDQEFIDYEVKIPIRSIIALSSYWGISPSDNQTTYTRRGQVASEVLMP
ncbi:hypothetical protein [Paenibacillus pasadenensis]|uniref:hypothetical protein n=1 Tax=Paenibacillus pasadenensis TaxID=217090 RepID=UPI000C7BF3EB|nr:hypothetical protein [Paenibacillus pasadenensis]